MLLFLPLGFLLATLFALATLPRLQPSFHSSWLLSLAGASLSMFSLLYLRLRLPLQFSFTGWEFGPGIHFDLTWALDADSWSLAFALLAILVAALLSAVSRAPAADWWSWLPGLSLVATALFAVAAMDALTFLLGWALVDILLVAISLSLLREKTDLRSALLSFSFNSVGTMLMLWAAVQYTASDLALSAFPVRATLFLVLAAAIRLGVFSLTLHALSEKRELVLDARLLMAIAPLAPTLAFLLRIPHPVSVLRAPLLLLFLVAGFYAAVRWFGRLGETTSLPHYLPALSAMALMAATVGQGAAALAWSLALLLGGSFFFLAERQAEERLPLLAAGLLILSAAPFTPLYAGAAMYQPPGAIWLVAAVGVHTLLMAAWLRRSLALQLSAKVERWVATIRLMGQFIPVLGLAALGLGLAPPLKPSALPSPVWMGLLVYPLSAALFLATRNRDLLPAYTLARVKRALSLDSIIPCGIQLGRVLIAPFRLVGALLEGRAGVLWALLSIVLLLSLIIQIGPAGL